MFRQPWIPAPTLTFKARLGWTGAALLTLFGLVALLNVISSGHTLAAATQARDQHLPAALMADEMAYQTVQIQADRLLQVGKTMTGAYQNQGKAAAAQSRTSAEVAHQVTMGAAEAAASAVASVQLTATVRTTTATSDQLVRTAEELVHLLQGFKI